MIELFDATKTYIQGRRTVNAVRGVTLRVNTGEYVTIMGPSGSGKPTGDLDTKTSREHLTPVAKLPEPGKRAVIMVTHDPTAAAYGTRLVKIRDGLIESDEPVHQDASSKRR